VALIDQPAVERVCCERRTADGEVAGGGRLHGADRIGVEVALEPRVGGRDCVQRRGVDDLVGRLPDVREVGHELRLGGQGGVGLPHGHRLVHAPSIEVGTDGAHKVSDEGEDFVGGVGPFEPAVHVLDVAVKGHIRHVDQLGHAAPQPPAGPRPGASVSETPRGAAFVREPSEVASLRSAAWQSRQPGPM
jgi:hypothetical protein